MTAVLRVSAPAFVQVGRQTLLNYELTCTNKVHSYVVF